MTSLVSNLWSKNSYTQDSKALIIISTPMTFTIVEIIPFSPNQVGTLSIKIQPIKILTSVLINKEIIIKLLFVNN